jgi:pyrrolysine biosynthesis protein PylC
VVHDEAELAAALTRLAVGGHEPVIEEYVAGPALSLEVLAWGGHAVALQTTGLEFDAVYDCKRVVAPVGEAGAGGPSAAGPGGACAWDRAVAPGTLAAFDAAAVRLAEGLGLNGLMDVEVMVRWPELKVLEIDARLPSQTPTTVYWSSDLNIVELLYQAARDGAPPRVDPAPRCACVYQHVHAHDGLLEVAGEHVMGSATSLQLVEGFFGVNEALTDYRPGARAWVATLIGSGAHAGEARAVVDEAVRALARRERLDVAPEAVSLAGMEAARS